VSKVLLVFLLLVSGTLLADDGIAKFKLACKDPGAVSNQIPPVDIKIACTDERYEWVPAGHDDATFHNRRTVSSSAVTSKPNVAAPMVAEKCDWPDTDMKCGGVKEVCKTVEMEFSVTCDEVLLMESVNKFCQLKVLAETVHNEKILTVVETGRSKKLCGVENYMDGKPMSQDWHPIPIRK